MGTYGTGNTEFSEIGIAMIDVYGDGESVYLIPDIDIELVLDEWREMDRKYINDEIGNDEYMGIDEFLKSKGIEPIPFRYVTL